jgi:hypothetical protein
VTSITLAWAVLFQAAALASPSGTLQSEAAAPLVLVDCAECDYDYMRTEITFVTFVAEPSDADVHILVTSQPTAGGGMLFALDFAGQGRFRGIDAVIRYVRGPAETAEEFRRGIITRLKLGLIRYAAETAAADRIDVVTSSQPRLPPPVRDPWNYWVFQSTIRGTFSNEQSSGSSLFSTSVSADRTTDNWKVILSASGEYSSDTFRLIDQPSLTTRRQTFASNGLVVKTVGSRWATGLKVMGGSSTYLNQDLAIRMAPGIEFNVFPYADATRRRLTIQYTAGPNWFRYVTKTIFDQVQETQFDETVLGTFDMKQRWGSAGTSIEASHYFSKLHPYRLVAVGNAEIRLYKGLSLSAIMTGALIHDQLYLPDEQATAEDILVRARQFATSRRFFGVLGFTYRFGSIYNTTVNPRFMGSPGGFFLIQ